VQTFWPYWPRSFVVGNSSLAFIAALPPRLRNRYPAAARMAAQLSETELNEVFNTADREDGLKKLQARIDAKTFRKPGSR
jgi:hypothetical protein